MSCRVLYISGSFGLGHVNRDLAIANEMRRICPEIEIHWLAGSPACEVLEAAGEAFAPEQAAYRGETELPIQPPTTVSSASLRMYSER